MSEGNGEKGQAFVISPIGDDASETRVRSDDVFNFIVKPAVNGFGLSLMRADMDPTPGQVTSGLLRSILESRVIIADLSERNPNVYYELGVVHSFARPVIILVDRSSTLTFDTQNERVIEIKDNGKIGAGEAEAAKKALIKSLKIVLDPGYKPRSIVTEVAGAQSLSNLAPDNPIASELSRLGEKMDELSMTLRTTRSSGDGTVLAQSVEELGLTVRTYNRLKRNGVSRVSQLFTLTEDDLQRIAAGEEVVRHEIRTAITDAMNNLVRATHGGPSPA